jgi:L-fuconolactonase
VNGVVLVQAAPTVEESDYLLSLAEQTPWIFGVVGWLDFDADDIEAAVAKRATHPKFVGVRPMLQDIADPDWILDPRRGRALTALASHGLVFDALIRPVHMKRIEQIARRHPNLRIVIDHAAKPTIDNALDPKWLEGLKALAACPYVVCKISGLLTELAPGAHPESVVGCIRAVVQAFGSSRVLWGSDWPVLTEASTYHEWHALTGQALSCLTESERRAVMGGNAVQTYIGVGGDRFENLSPEA